MVIQLLANGVVAGCVYGLIALGFGLIYSTTKKKRGHPLEGCCQEAHHSLCFFFFLFLPARFVTYSYAPLFSFGSVSDKVRTSHPSGSRHGRMLLIRSNDLPAPGNLCCPRKLSVPRRVQGYRITNPMAPPLGGPTPKWLAAWAYHAITS